MRLLRPAAGVGEAKIDHTDELRRRAVFVLRVLRARRAGAIVGVGE
jgi:hypothetical protein